MKIKLEKQHYQWGLTIFLVFVCCALVFFAIYRFDVIQEFVALCGKVLSPFIYGLVMAYLLCPVYNITVRGTYSLLNKGKYKFKRDLTISKAFGSVVSIALLLVIIAGVLWMIIPGLVDSIIKVVDVLPAGMDHFSQWINIKFAKLPVAQATFDKWIAMLTDSMLDFAKNTLLPQTGNIAAGISGTVMGAVSLVMNFIIGMIVCIYFLNIKDTLAAQAKKVLYANLKESTAEEILDGADFTNRTFGGFISGKIIDSFIIGIICFMVMSIAGWEYNLLISCIIAITNIIPFFGPFIGAIPSALLLLMVSPGHALGFLIFVIILQQFDGNILGPKILGGSTGLESFWVLFAILVGGGLFGFVGMVIGVPVFAVIYAYMARTLNRRLLKKGFSVNVSDYKVDKYRIKNKRKRKQRFSVKAGTEELKEELQETEREIEQMHDEAEDLRESAEADNREEKEEK